MKRTESTLFVLELLLLLFFAGCSTRNIENEITRIETRKRAALNRLNQAFPGYSIERIDAELDRRISERQRALQGLQNELAQIRNSAPQIRAVSAKYSDFQEAFRRFETQFEEIRKQDQIFNRKRGELRYSGTSIATRALRQEIRDINANVLNQVSTQQAWFTELTKESNQQIRAIAYEPYRKAIQERFDELYRRSERSMDNLKVIQLRHQTFRADNQEGL